MFGCKSVIKRDGSITDGCEFEVVRIGEKKTLVRDSNGDKFAIPNRKLDFGAGVGVVLHD